MTSKFRRVHKEYREIHLDLDAENLEEAQKKYSEMSDEEREKLSVTTPTKRQTVWQFGGSNPQP